MITFVGNDADGRPLKRKQTRRACEKCRRQKKRCTHQSIDERSELSLSDAQQNTSSFPGRLDLQQSARHSGQNGIEDWQASPDTNQTAERLSTQLLNSATAEPTTLGERARNLVDAVDRDRNRDRDARFIGDSNPEVIFVVDPGSVDAATVATSVSPERVIGVWAPTRRADGIRSLPSPVFPPLLSYLEDACSKALPSPDGYDALYQLYVQDIHPVLPIIHLEAYQRQPNKPKLLLKLAICLITSGHSKAMMHLGQKPMNFTVQATQLLRSAIDNGLSQDQQIIMQVLVILAISTQLSDDRHASAEYTARAVTYIHTGGFHHDTTSRSDDVYITRLFCCIFALDRLNAAIQGRPVSMHERDIGRDLHACIRQQESLFRLLLQVILLLDEVITLYRPSLNSNNDSAGTGRDVAHDFPIFEDLLSTCGAIRAPAALIATVETLYHAVAMLSCRLQSPGELSRRSALHTRQSLSAASMMSIASNEFRGQLSVLPFVAYAVSLALRVTYRDLRFSKSTFTRTRARRQLLRTCALLRDFGEIYPSSLQMADLAEQTVREMDKAYTTVATQRKKSGARAASEPRLPGLYQAEPSRCDHDLAEVNGDRHVSPSTEAPETVRHGDLADDYDMFAFDPGQFDFDLDIFDHFDPDFNIQAIDAALANSIDPSQPISTLD